MRIRYMGAIRAVVLGLSLMVCGLAAAQGPSVGIDIKAQPMPAALRELGVQTGLQILFRVEDVANGGKSAPAVAGTFSAKEALDRLLVNSGLKYEFVNDRTVRVLSARASFATPNTDPDPATSSAPAGTEAWSGTTMSTQQGQLQPELAEIIVSAQKRQERLLDVPVPVTAIDAARLAEQGQSRLQDYFATVPGLNFSGQSVGGAQDIAIRGITTGSGTNPTVAVTVDDVPYGSSSLLGFGESLFPDLDPSDLSRIEVLRGPQGTLYGASSIGGLIKFVTTDPATDELTGRVQALGSGVEHGDLGYAIRAAANVPVSDALAVRVSGFDRRDSGFVDNVLTGGRGVNRIDSYGGHLSALWRASEVWSLKIGALLQVTDGDGTPAVDANSSLQPIFGDLKQARLPGTEGYSARAQLYTATLTARTDAFRFVSISGYGISRWTALQDFTRQQGANAQSLGVSGASEPNFFETRKLTQELRLSSEGTHRLDWLLGAFYTNENTSLNQAYVANDFASGAPAGVLINFSEPSKLSEYSLFADVTAHATDRIDVQFGGRYSHNRQRFDETDSGPLVPGFDGAPSPYIQPTERTSDNAFTYLVTPRMKITPDLMIYARFASGYRLGGPNLEAALFGAPLSYGPDKTNNYELGIKSEVLDHIMSLDASVYYIDWKRIQVYVVDPNTGSAFYENAGSARSDGMELSATLRLPRSLTVTAEIAYNDAKLTQDLPPSYLAVGLSGDRLPFSSRFAGSLTVNQDLMLTQAVTGFFGGSVRFVGDRAGNFVGSDQPRLHYPSYTQLNLSAGVRWDRWTANLFVNNVTNKRGIVGGGSSNAQSPYYVVYIQPLTAGLSVSRTFQNSGSP